MNNKEALETYVSVASKRPFSLSESTINEYLKYIGYLTKHFSDKDLLSITKKEMRGYMMNLEGISDSTYNARLSSYKSFYTVMNFYDEDLECDPTVGLVSISKVEQKHKEPLTPEESTAMLNACNIKNITGLRMKAFLSLMLSTGLRICEVADLKIEQYKNRDINGKMELGKTKGDKGGVIWIRKDVASDIDAYLSSRTDSEEYLFLSNYGNQIQRKRMSEALKTIAKKAGIKEERIATINNHSLRATMVSQMTNSGVPIDVVSKLARHSSIQTTYKSYLTIDENRLVSAMNK